MRPLILFTALCILAAPAAAQELGERTRSPQAMLGDLSLAPGQDDLDQAIAAAAAHPLGSRENPVRVGGPDGERAYIARLRCSDGTAPQIGPRSAGGVGAFGSVVGAYLLDCRQVAPGRTTLLIDMYHAENRENRAPPGFTIVPR